MEAKIEIPDDIKDFLTITDCRDFAADRYLLTEDLKKIAIDIVETRKTVAEMRKMNLDYLNATLLYGPPGTGKTKFGEYLAYKLGLDFAFLNLANLMDGIMGSTARNITKVFNFMRDLFCRGVLELETFTKDSAENIKMAIPVEAVFYQDMDNGLFKYCGLIGIEGYDDFDIG